MNIKTQGAVWTVILSAVLMLGQWLDDTYFHTGIQEWLPKFLNSAQTILGLATVAVGFALTYYMEKLADKAHAKPPVEGDSVNWTQIPASARSVNWTGEPKLPFWKRVL